MTIAAAGRTATNAAWLRGHLTNMSAIPQPLALSRFFQEPCHPHPKWGRQHVETCDENGLDKFGEQTTIKISYR